MKNADFVALLTANAAKTTNIRCYSRVWPSGARRVPQHILFKIGAIVSLIQAKVNEGIFCNKETEGILIYNFQPAMVSKDCQFCTIDCLVVPKDGLDTTWELVGTPLHIAVNLITSEVVNNTQSMLDLGLIEIEDVISEGLEEPVIYGKYTDYEPTTSFIALTHSSPIDPGQIFTGALNGADFINRAPMFDSHVEAQEFLKNDEHEHKLIGEITGPKSNIITVKQEGISNYLLKVISPSLDNVRATSNKEVRSIETRMEDEVTMLLIASKEEELNPDETINIGHSQ